MELEFIITVTIISKKYPDSLFTLKGEGEDAGDNWTKYYRAGRCQEAKQQSL